LRVDIIYLGDIVIPPHVYREAIHQAQGAKCFWCNVKMRRLRRNEKQLRNNTATLEHLIPKSKGGDSGPLNLVVACNSCNQIRGDAMKHPITGQPFNIVNGQVRFIQEITTKKIIIPPTPPVEIPLSTDKGQERLRHVLALLQCKPTVGNLRLFLVTAGINEREEDDEG
jgi:hypothetical protein